MNLRDGLISTLVECTSAVSQALTTLKYLGKERVVLHALEFLVWAKVGIAVVKTHHKTKRNHVVIHMVHERTTISIGGQGIAHRVSHETSLMILRLHAPHLLYTDSISLRISPDFLTEF